MFGVIIPGQPIITNFVQNSPTAFSLSIPTGANHMAIFLSTPIINTELVAGIYFNSDDNEWKYLGFLSDLKPSAIFKVNLSNTPFKIGISIEPPKMEETSLVISKSNNNNFAVLVMKNLYNYVKSFNINLVPIKVFEDWYNNLIRKLSIDPNYLEKQD